MTTWSHSRLQYYEDCPRKYKYRYIDKIEPERKSIYLFLGSIVHQVLEKLYKSLHYDNIPALEALLEEFDRLWQTEKPEEITVPNGRTLEEFKQLGRRCIQNYYKRHYPFKDGTTLGIEDAALLEIEDGQEKIKFIGYIDRLSRREDGTIEIHDYKTGKVHSQANLDRDRQLALYQLAIQQRWPDIASVALVWHYVAYDVELQSRRTPEQLEQVKRDVINIIKEIEADQTFEPRKSALCSYCDYQSRCPLWKHLFQIEAPGKPQESISKLVDEYGDLKRQKKEIEIKIKVIEEELPSRMTDEPAETFYGERWGITVTQTEGVSVPPKGDPKREAIEKILREAGKWNDVSALDTALLKKLVLEKTLAQDILDKIIPGIEKETHTRFSVAARNKEEVEQESP